MRKLCNKLFILGFCLLTVNAGIAAPGQSALGAMGTKAVQSVRVALNNPLVRAGFVGAAPYAVCSLSERVKNRKYKFLNEAYEKELDPLMRICGIASSGLFLASDASSRLLSKQAAKNLVPFFRGLSLVTTAPAVLLSVANAYFLVSEDRDKQKIKIKEVEIDETADKFTVKREEK